MVEIVAETARLLLRRIEEGDAELQFGTLDTPALMAHLGGVKTLAEIEERHLRTRALWASEGFGFCFLIEKASGEVVGHCGIKRVDNKLAKNLGDHEIGWLVREDRWRRGYGFEAMRAILALAFECHRTPHVVALTSSSNEPSWRLMEKLGMKRRTDLDFDDPAYPRQDNPTIVYSLTAEQWRAAA